MYFIYVNLIELIHIIHFWEDFKKKQIDFSKSFS